MSFFKARTSTLNQAQKQPRQTFLTSKHDFLPAEGSELSSRDGSRCEPWAYTTITRHKAFQEGTKVM